MCAGATPGCLLRGGGGGGGGGGGKMSRYCCASPKILRQSCFFFRLQKFLPKKNHNGVYTGIIMAMTDR